MEKPSAHLQELIVSIWQKNLRVHDVSKDLEKYPEVKEYLSKLLQSDEWFTNIRTTLTLCAKHIYEKQYCLNCKKELPAKKVIQGKKYCSCKCNCSSKEQKEKTIQKWIALHVVWIVYLLKQQKILIQLFQEILNLMKSMK